MSTNYETEQSVAKQIAHLQTYNQGAIIDMQMELSNLKLWDWVSVYDLMKITNLCQTDPRFWRFFLRINEKHIGDVLRFDILDLIDTLTEHRDLTARLIDARCKRIDHILGMFNTFK